MTKIVRHEVNTAEQAWGTGLHPVLKRVYAARGIRTPAELDLSFEQLIPWNQLLGIEGAADLLYQALVAGERILVVGDFDADGATSTALAVRALRAFGAVQVDYLVPNRFRFGYGLTPEIVAVAAEREPDLIVTVDNGISSVSGVEAANRVGIRVLITDHHLPGAELPPAAVIVNPNQPGDRFPSKCMAGVGVLYYVMLALRVRLREGGWFRRQGIREPNMAAFLDLVALGTVADVVPLDHNNRVLVQQGLMRIRAGRCCAGVSALLAVAGRNQTRVVSSDLGFAVAPRLNAAGRLTDMSQGIECLLSDDDGHARALAAELDALNRERRQLETQMRDEAIALVDRLSAEREDSPAAMGLCLYDPGWHQGVVGLVASRLKDLYHRPVIAFAPGPDGELRGSARSVEGVHIRDVLDQVATRHPNLLTRFGGHAMAAGLSLREDHLDPFRRAFERELNRLLKPEDLGGRVLSDGALVPDDLTLDLAEQVRDGGPWGQGFSEPLFDGVFDVLEQRLVGGERHLKLLLKPAAGARGLEAIAFHPPPAQLSARLQRVVALYRLDVNEFRGDRRLQLLIEKLEPESPSGAAVPHP